MNDESQINIIDDWNERVSSRCYYSSCDLLHHQRHHHQLEPTAWLLRITTIMLSSSWFLYSYLQPTTTPIQSNIFVVFHQQRLAAAKIDPLSSQTEGPVCPYYFHFLWALHLLFSLFTSHLYLVNHFSEAAWRRRQVGEGAEPPAVAFSSRNTA